MKSHTFFMLLLAIMLGVFGALIAWTLIVKNQVSAQLATTTAANPILGALTSL